MDLINPSPVLALPTTMWAAARVFAGSDGLTEADAFRRLSPIGLRETNAAGASGHEPPPNSGAEQAVKALVELSLLDDIPRVGSDLARRRWTAAKPGDYDEFCALLLGAVMARAHREELGETRNPGGARDLLRGLAWLLTKDPLSDRVSSVSVQADRDAAQKDDSRVFINPTRWNGFRYWSEALGFASPVLISGERQQNTLTSEASRAVGRTLRSAYAPGVWNPALSVVDDLRERLPVLPGGAASVALGFSPPADAALDAVTSFALLVLEQTGEVELKMLSDGTEAIHLARLDPLEVERVVTHLVVREK